MPALTDYLNYLQIQRNLSENTLKSYENDLKHFLDFCWEQLDFLGRPAELREIDRYLVRDYLAFLTRHGYARSSLARDRKSTRLNSSHVRISYAVFCLKKKKKKKTKQHI